MPTPSCHVCGKAAVTGHNVSHSNRKTNRKWRPNLQKVRIRERGKVHTVLVCTRCIKSNRIQKA
ncbi:MAG: 50S ribosomal protein L28 [Candidatus Hydrogenedentota bacterium]|nr:MAG: 50S ribosomal protein L28 [Candidatus Hydrogenedentota bacterium]